MADLKFSDLQSAGVAASTQVIPADTFFVHSTDNKLYIDVDKLIGETGSGLATERVSELMFKLQRLSRIAQNIWNNTNPSNQINTFGALAYAAPSAAPGSTIGLVSIATVTNNYSVKVDQDEVSGT